MQRFAIVLFALVALFAIVPSSVNALSHVKRDTNANRFARGLPPRTPSRRSTAKRHQNSQVSVPRSGRIQVRDHGNKSVGYLQNAASGPGGINSGGNDLSVQYNSKDHTITCTDSQFTQGGSYFGGFASQSLKPGSPSSVPLTNGDNGSQDSPSCLWTVESSGRLSAKWENSDGSSVSVSCAYNSAKNTFVLTGDSNEFCSQNSGWDPVELFIIN